ncbi:hypothetical protein [Streptomyces sp. NPDC002133]|uniref:hypothetical protein n=1 Tax=Streptomyces sp. NPDC002133 TaxID=3154409 RepID=UPI00331BDF7C
MPWLPAGRLGAAAAARRWRPGGHRRLRSCARAPGEGVARSVGPCRRGGGGAEGREGFADALSRQDDGRIAVPADGTAARTSSCSAPPDPVRGKVDPGDGGAGPSIRPGLIPIPGTGGHVVVDHRSTSGEPAVFALP